MLINYLLNSMNSHQKDEAVVWRGNAYSYESLIGLIERWSHEVLKNNISPGSIVALQADYSPNSIALLIALVKLNCVIVPLTIKSKVKQDEYCQIAQVEFLITIDQYDQVEFYRLDSIANHPLLTALQNKMHAGLVIFSSGSTGNSKGAVHDFIPLFEKFKTPKRKARVIAFLLFDHIGGLNTLFYTLFNGGCLIIPECRTPTDVCKAIAYFKADALTTTPTFLNLLMISETINNYNLNSLRFINYGTEVMPDHTLNNLREMFPNARLSQAYGLSEIGVLPARSKSSDSLYMKIEGDGFETRIVNGLLEIKSNSSMLGYLNAPSPFTEDGWLKTGDAVDVDGEYIRILGRKSELINVGGEKVYPVEIENVLQQMSDVEQVSVFSETNPIVGQMVTAKVKLKSDESLSDFRVRLHKFCKARLPGYMIPQKIILTNSILHSERFKKVRKF